MKRERVADIGFQNPPLDALGVEVLSLRDLRRRAPLTLLAPQRVQFHLLLLVQHGRSAHMVDFENISLEPNDLFFIRPGQVQQWRLDDSLQGLLLLIKPEALTPSLARAGRDLKLLDLDEWPHLWRLPPARRQQVLFHLQCLQEDIRLYNGREVEAAAIWHQLLAFLLHLAGDVPPPRQTSTAQQALIYRRFAKAVEAGLSDRLSAREHATRLGVSDSTLERACKAVAGLSAKQFIAKRTVLEAKRLLLHSTYTVASVGLSLGFEDATNFVKFFRRFEGVTPGAYRAKLTDGER